MRGVAFKFYETKLNEDTAPLADGCEAVCVFVNDTVNAAVIDRLHAGGVRLIALRSAGYNNVDIEHAFGKIHVVHVPAYSPYAVAEHAMALLLTSIRRVHKAYNRTREFNFSLNGLTGFDLHGKTVGVVLLNTSRGALIDAEALLEGIKARQIGAACLDVYEEESDIFFRDLSGHILGDDLLARLISMPNVIVTSHQAFLTEDALNNIAETTVNNILSYFENDGLCDNELCYRCGHIERCKKERKERCF